MASDGPRSEEKKSDKLVTQFFGAIGTAIIAAVVKEYVGSGYSSNILELFIVGALVLAFGIFWSAIRSKSSPSFIDSVVRTPTRISSWLILLFLFVTYLLGSEMVRRATVPVVDTVAIRNLVAQQMQPLQNQLKDLNKTVTSEGGDVTQLRTGIDDLTTAGRNLKSDLDTFGNDERRDATNVNNLQKQIDSFNDKLAATDKSLTEVRTAAYQLSRVIYLKDFIVNGEFAALVDKIHAREKGDLDFQLGCLSKKPDDEECNQPPRPASVGMDDEAALNMWAKVAFGRKTGFYARDECIRATKTYPEEDNMKKTVSEKYHQLRATYECRWGEMYTLIALAKSDVQRYTQEAGKFTLQPNN